MKSDIKKCIFSLCIFVIGKSAIADFSGGYWYKAKGWLYSDLSKYSNYDTIWTQDSDALAKDIASQIEAHGPWEKNGKVSDFTTVKGEVINMGQHAIDMHYEITSTYKGKKSVSQGTKYVVGVKSVHCLPGTTILDVNMPYRHGWGSARSRHCTSLPYENQDFGPPETSNDCSESPMKGNPVHVASGNKHQVENDFKIDVSPELKFTRYYNSYTVTGHASLDKRYMRQIGVGWRHSYQARIAGITAEAAYLIRANGNAIVLNGIDTNTYSDNGYLLSSIDSGYSLAIPNGNVEFYDETGLLIKIAFSNGRELNVIREGGIINRIEDSFGRSINFTYRKFPGSDNTFISAIKTPDGGEYSFNYDYLDRLISVTYPDNTQKTYHYEDRDAFVLTGMTNENGDRYANWSYGAHHAARDSEHAGGVDKTTFTYLGNHTILTNALGKQTTYHYTKINGANRITSVEGHQSDNCAAANKAYTYDTNGFVTSKTDWEGNTTTFVRDNLGRELERVEASGTPEARTVTTEWHADYSKPVRITEPNKVITFSYDTNGQLLERKEQAIN